MPQPAGELVLYCYEMSNDDGEAADRILRDGVDRFHRPEVQNPIVKMNDYTGFHYQPFENRDDNKAVLEECINELSERFPEMEVWLDERYNKDMGNPVEWTFSLYIAPSRDAVQSEWSKNRDTSLEDVRKEYE